MSLLAFTRVLRGGKCPESRFETREVSSKISQHGDSVDFLFSLPMNDGQTSPVRLQVGLADLKNLLHEVAVKLPGSAGLFAECTSIAINGAQQVLECRELGRDPMLRS